MALESVRDDLLVAGVAAACAVTLTLSLELLANVSVSVWLHSTPLAVYFAYLFSRKGGPYGPLDTAQNWAVLAVAVTVVAGAYALFA
ncbi:hypothetical protein HUG10_05080 [Halorarum halophilum]|uniref:DUF8049 domain-containing protein n=1 Tax=Halorarum halophilum TaxID=2743090 RepID=A0A7D5GGP6_9EURY|nr:hypothetical protein [Halobaculum halophilum]QLG26951.1 hypothetical protein HUG10_05080 [Halobaculum halophilum]